MAPNAKQVTKHYLEVLGLRAQEGIFLIHSLQKRDGSERFSVWLMTHGRVANDYTAIVCKACGLKLVERQNEFSTVVEGGGMDLAYDLAYMIVKALGIEVSFQIRMGGVVKTIKP